MSNEILFYIVAPIVLIAVAALIWTYGKDWPRPASQGVWLGCSMLLTVAGLIASILFIFVGAASEGPGGSASGFQVLVIGLSPLAIAIAIVVISARGRAAPLPDHDRLLRELAVAAFLIGLILLSYFVLTR